MKYDQVPPDGTDLTLEQWQVAADEVRCALHELLTDNGLTLD